MAVIPQQAKIYIAGHRGLVGSALYQLLSQRGYHNLIVRTHEELDLLEQAEVRHFFATERPDYVLLAAAKVGGILANTTYPAHFIYNNLQIQNNIVDAAYRNGTQKLLFLGSSCIYPKHTPQPMKEEYLLSGALEPTNQWYAISKIAGIKLCQAYRQQYNFNAIAIMPTNLYGPGDNFHLKHAHVIPALMHRFQLAKEQNVPSVTVWGTGNARREFLHIKDLVDATLYLLEHYEDSEIINVGFGEDVSIRELAEIIKEVVGYQGELQFDTTKPDGTMKKLLDVTRLSQMGWHPQIPLKTGIQSTYEWFLANRHQFREK